MNNSTLAAPILDPPSTANEPLYHGRLNRLYRSLGLAQQRQPARHIAASLVGVAHLRDQVCPLADQMIQQIIHGTAPAIHATSRTRARQNINLFTSIMNTSVNHKC